MKFLRRRRGLQTKNRIKSYEKVYSIVEQCPAARVPVFVKQDSALRDGEQGRIPDVLWNLKALPRPQRVDVDQRQMSLFATHN